MHSDKSPAKLSELPLEVEDFANAGVWHYYMASKKIIWSTGIHKIYGVEDHQFKGTFDNYIKYLHPDDIEPVKQIIEKALSTKTSFSFDNRIIAANGDNKYVRNWGIVIRDDSGKATQITFLSMDITDGINAESALRESEIFNKKLVDHTPNAILIETVDGEILFANQRTADLLKAPSVDYLVGKNAAQFRVSESKEDLKQRALKTLTSGKASPKIEITYKCLDGSIKIGEYVTVPFEYKDRDTILVIVNDITDQKNGLTALKNSQAQVLRFIENTPVAVAMFDTKMNYLTCSEQYLSDWWVDDKQPMVQKIVGKNHYEIFPDVLDNWKDIHTKVLKGETLSNENDLFTKTNGKKEWLRWKAQPWYKAANEIGGLILFTEFITERKEAEEAITESRNRLNALIQNLPGLVYQCHASDFKLLFVSSGCLELTGYKSEEFFGNNNITFESIAHPEDLGKVREVMKMAIETRKPFEISYRLYTKDGQLKYFNERGQPLFAESGEPLTIEGVVVDITERVKAEQDLRQSKESLDEAQRVSHLGSWEWYLESNEVLWSDEYFRICGEEPGAFKPTFDIAEKYIHPDDVEKVRNAIANTVKNGTAYQMDKRIIRKDRSLRYVRSQAELVTDENGKPVKVIGSMQDITEQKLTEKALTESQNRNTALINALPDLMFIATTDGVLLDIQVSDTSLLFKTKEELLGSNIRNFLAEKDALEFIKKSETAEKTGENQIVQYSLPAKDQTKYFEARIVKHEEGKVLAVIRDITKSKTDEAQLVALTEELTNSNAELKQFAYITSHDLRSPVVNIDTLLKFYQSDSRNNADKEEIFDKIVSSVDQLKSTLNDLIQLVSIKDNTQNLLAEVNLDEVVTAVVNGLETQIKAENAVITMDFDKQPYVTSRRATVYSIVQNLVSNALKYTSNNKPEIIITSFPSGEFTCLSIKDNGIGIDLKKHRGKLFGMYQRFHENKEGKGLGLYIIKSQIEGLGGYIDVDSQVGKGTEFKVYFKKLIM